MPLDSHPPNERNAATIAAKQAPPPLYVRRTKIYPARVKGTIRRTKWAVLIVCLAVYYLVPWLRWDRGFGRPNQAVLIDMAGHRAYFFGIEIWPQEIYYITGLLILAAVGLFFVTSMFGRLWCGFTCPQTVWTDLFMWTERLIEGERAPRMRLDRQAMTLGKLTKKVAKHTVWLLIGAATGGAWIMYFNDAPTVVGQMVHLEADATVWFFFGLFTATTYLLAGWAREQVCTYMCPWPRFQAAMVDEETLTVTYRAWRGEKRGSYKRGESWEDRCDCVDCRACVVACPTGIDIRDGSQLECIGCGLCIDACDEVMDRFKRPRGLIAFDTYNNQLARQRGEQQPSYRFLRPRTFIYSAILLLAASAMLFKLATRATIEIGVLPDRSPLFVTLSDGSIRNGYTLHISNMNSHDKTFWVRVTGLPDAMLGMASAESVLIPAEQGMPISVKSDSVGTFRIYLHAPRAAVNVEAPLDFIVRAPDGEVVEHASNFRGPAR